MKKHLISFLALALCLALLPLGCLCESADSKSAAQVPNPGLPRPMPSVRWFDTAQNLTAHYGIEPEEFIRYSPANGKPLNAYMVTDLDCELGLKKDGKYYVSDKGITSSMEGLLKTGCPQSSVRPAARSCSWAIRMKPMC